jgi:hypothetical protein
MPDSEVLYIKGTPQDVIGDVQSDISSPRSHFRPATSVSEVKAPKTIRDFPIWEYSVGNDTGFYLAVSFSKQPDRRVVSVGCYSRNHTTCPSVVGVPIGASEELLVARLGPGASRIQGQVKIISYPNLNLTFYLERKQVYMIIVGDDDT